MPITLPTPPAGFDNALRRAVGTVSAAGAMKFAAAGGAAPGVSPSAPHRLYAIGLDDAAAGKGLAAARAASWRAFLVLAQSPVALAEVPEVAGGLAPDAAVSEGPLVEQAAEAIRAAEQSGAVGAGAYELRFLHVPAIYVLAVWLHGPEDLFVPVMGPQLKPRQVYRAADFFAAIQPVARALATQSPTQGAALY